MTHADTAGHRARALWIMWSREGRSRPVDPWADPYMSELRIATKASACLAAECAHSPGMYEIVPSHGLLALAYNFRGIRPAR